MATVLFDGPNKLAIVQTAPINGFVDLDVQVDLYSDWLEWLQANTDNAKYPLFMKAIGGEDTVPGQTSGLQFFVLNGWKIRPYEAHHTLRVNGNIIGENGAEIITPTLGAFTVSAQIQWSNLANAVNTGNVVAGLTAQQEAILIELWTRIGLNAALPATNYNDGSYAFGDVVVDATINPDSSITHQRL